MFLPKKMSESKIKSTKHWTSRRWAWPKIFIDLLFDYSKNILFLTKTRSYFSISILLSKTFGHVVNFNCCINRVVEKLINLKLISWSFQMWLLIIWGTNWTQGFHCTGLSVDGWLLIIMARMLPKHWSCDISRYYLDNLLILLRHPLFDCLSSQHGDVRVCQ